jgi:hypothetical protein
VIIRRRRRRRRRRIRRRKILCKNNSLPRRKVGRGSLMSVETMVRGQVCDWYVWITVVIHLFVEFQVRMGNVTTSIESNYK